jgi:hypothetical protein
MRKLALIYLLAAMACGAFAIERPRSAAAKAGGTVLAYDPSACGKCNEDNQHCHEDCKADQENCPASCDSALRRCLWNSCW